MLTVHLSIDIGVVSTLLAIVNNVLLTFCKYIIFKKPMKSLSEGPESCDSGSILMCFWGHISRNRCRGLGMGLPQKIGAKGQEQGERPVQQKKGIPNRSSIKEGETSEDGYNAGLTWVLLRGVRTWAYDMVMSGEWREDICTEDSVLSGEGRGSVLSSSGGKAWHVERSASYSCSESDTVLGNSRAQE